MLGKGASASHRDPLLVEPACSLTLLKVEPGWADPSPHDLGEQRTAVAWTGHWARTTGLERVAAHSSSSLGRAEAPCWISQP